MKKDIYYFWREKSKNRLQSITFFFVFGDLLSIACFFFPLTMSNATYRYGQHAKLSQLTFLYR